MAFPLVRTEVVTVSGLLDGHTLEADCVDRRPRGWDSARRLGFETNRPVRGHALSQVA